MPIRFDDSLPLLVQSLVADLGAARLTNVVVVREAGGRLSVVFDGTLSDAQKKTTEENLRGKLGPYARDDRVVADASEPGVASLLSDTANFQVIDTKHGIVRLIDRRIVGADWLNKPVAAEATPPRVVFASLKGGVGRSTALSVLAADYARRGKNVLAIDFDLEAPGIGSMLLGVDRRPPYGTLDFLVENGLGGITSDELREFVGTSNLTTGAGLIDVAPAYGTKTLAHPSNYLAKLSRAVLEDFADEGAVSLRQQIGTSVERLSTRRPYDLVLIDSRAGLAEISAGPLLGLGATVLLFGTPDTQTVEGYRYLLASLSNLIRPGDDLRWRERLKVVLAKRNVQGDAFENFIAEMHELFASFLYDEVEGVEGFNFDIRDPDGPHFPVSINFDPSFIAWDPTRRPDTISESFYATVFSEFISKVAELIASGDSGTAVSDG
jgi:cellulose biosynthesis protein BcsQ